jgi:SHS2 domain-containing protein
VPYTVLSHTADTGIEATAGTLLDLLGELATGMFDLMGSPQSCTAEQISEIDVEWTSNEELVVDVLSELLYHSEVEDLFLCQFEVRATGPGRIHISASGVQNALVEITGPPIKAVTYHDVAVHETAAGWYGRVYFDV